MEPFLTSAISAAATGLGLVMYGTMAPRSRLFGPVEFQGNTADPPRVALTFDDGPDETNTPRVLEALAKYGVPAAFFVVGSRLQTRPALCREAHNQGHLIGNHSFDHSWLGPCFGKRYWIDQLRRTNDLIHQTIGRTPALFRPPLGFKNPRVLSAARRLGLTTVTWTRRGLDGRPTTAEQVHRRLALRAGAGDVLVLHDSAGPGFPSDGTAMLTALPRVIQTLRERGIEFERLDRLLDVADYLPAGRPPDDGPR